MSDTSVLIDLDRGALVEPSFRLPFEFTVPDLLYERELKDHGGPDFIRRGLRIEELDGDGVSLALGYRRKRSSLSLLDNFALALAYRTRKSWSRRRRVVGKAEYLPKGENPRFVVTNLPARRACAKRLYEKLYCARGDLENRIKEQQLDLFTDRTSAHTMRANQLCRYFSSFAYVLMQSFRRLGTR